VRVPAAEWASIVSTGTWRPGCPGGRAALRRVEVGYIGYDGRPHRGALVVNADVAASVARVFTRLYAERFPIRRMVPIEAYRGDDNASMRADNTSAFNCRMAAQANAPSAASPHANGRAIDLNPYENPWTDPRCHCWRPLAYWGTHRSGRGVITGGGPAVAAFRAEGWIWRGHDAQPDLQHFDTGYPSRPVHR
jgi:D-alanyl-D-alanine carboxypeptidase